MNSNQLKEFLAKYSLFKDLDDMELTRVAEISILRKWEKNSHVFLQGDTLENVYFILDGKVKIYKSDINGREQIVAILKNGEMFPHIGFFRKGGYPAFAEVLETSDMVVIPIALFEKVLIENPQLSIKVFKVLGEKIVDLQDRLEEQILNNTYEQIIKLLIRLAEKHGETLEDGRVRLKPEFTNRDLANMIGTTRETVSRTLTKMKKDELLVMDGTNNMFFDPRALLEEIL
ncbi:Crp/Fnr family transcriptional regulator [Mesobacillus foraminis]|uniref:Crp/Fnr family transcriptional regulator n=1 Tax=Mesobacillus foraminis TaxID=279826 RepID=UPI001BEC1F9D|nr:Crp/Fnr family transcriptional regulator [Mesobacillus foraminis]MBT2754952.1 Crp/Fnr family transcriptional regulator [Mesobacillus foraminis]